MPPPRSYVPRGIFDNTPLLAYHQHFRAADLSRLQFHQCSVRVFQRKLLDLGFDRDCRGELEKFTDVVSFSGGKLQDKYNLLKSELDKSKSKAKSVRSRISGVENVAEALFKEWEKELGQYSSDKLRRSSEQKLKTTRQRYSQLIAAMKRAESKIAPVLTAFNDQVLFLKHNLNAQAIASLQSELASVEADIATLIKEMEASIAEADEFITAMAGS